MSTLGRSARRATAAASAILFGGLVLVSLLLERGAKLPSLVSVAAAVGGRRTMVGVNGGYVAQRTPEEFKADDPFSSSKRRVPNGPDPIHNRELESREDRQAERRRHAPEGRKLPKCLFWIRSLC